MNFVIYRQDIKKIINKPVQVRRYKYITALPGASAPTHKHQKTYQRKISQYFSDNLRIHIGPSIKGFATRRAVKIDSKIWCFTIFVF